MRRVRKCFPSSEGNARKGGKGDRPSGEREQLRKTEDGNGDEHAALTEEKNG